MLTLLGICTRQLILLCSCRALIVSSVCLQVSHLSAKTSFSPLYLYLYPSCFTSNFISMYLNVSYITCNNIFYQVMNKPASHGGLKRITQLQCVFFLNYDFTADMKCLIWAQAPKCVWREKEPESSENDWPAACKHELYVHNILCKHVNWFSCLRVPSSGPSCVCKHDYD